MLNTNLLDLIIGLVFIFTIYGLLASSFLELIAGLFGLRAKMLEAMLINFFESRTELTSKKFKRCLFKFWLLKPQQKDEKKRIESFSDAFFKSSRIVSLKRYHRYNGPSYLTPDTFADNIIDLFSESGLGSKAYKLTVNLNACQIQIENANIKLDPDFSNVLRSLYSSANGSIDEFKHKLEKYYDELMERVSGAYKRLTRYLTIIIGFAIAFCFNVDTIQICNDLSSNPEKRLAIVNSAIKFIDEHSSKFSESEDTTQVIQLDSLYKNTVSMINSEIKQTNNLMALGWPCDNNEDDEAINWWKKILGLMITAFAISLGSEFWFDILKKLLKVRSAIGSKSTENNKEKGNE